MSDYYPAGSTVLVPIPIDVLWSILNGVIHQRVQVGVADKKIIAPPRKRRGAVSAPILAFVETNPGRYCAREIIQQHPNFKQATIKWALYTGMGDGTLSRDENGKWHPQHAKENGND